MTVERPIASIEETLQEVLTALTLPVAARVTGKTAGYLSQLSNSNLDRFNVSLDIASKLDLEHARLFGGSMPLYEHYGLIVKAGQSDSEASHAELIAAHQDVVKEVAEMQLASFDAQKPNATKRDRAKALREGIGAVKAVSHMVTLLQKMASGGSARSP
ncbi:hypothetical protein [Sphingomonas sp. Ag1]|uniref:hypothetical protein n=1 Tax=Sphingomonas sp. Ag1 TaxID=1642949 RepID=UPI0006218A58|nr:hypothetical protein [Sphingomonas sp. Ag1]KKI17480.1 hypothetical protein XM50_14300 [Sphingomonas sp. Ag1]